MKIIKLQYLLLFAIVASLYSCDDDDELYPQLGEDPRNLNEILSETPDLSVLYQAIVAADLDSTLRETSTYTVFAPTNAAFEGVDLSSLSEEERQNVLLNHVINTTTADFASTFSTGYLSTMATGPEETNLSIYVNTSNGITLNQDVSLVPNSSDVGSTNGVLHVVDGILMPPSVLDHAEANPEFSTFTEAVEMAGLTDALSVMEVTDTENPNYPLTVFVPTNAAFENLMMQLNGAFGWSSLSDIPTDVLKEILQYHVIGGENLVAETLANTEQTPMLGETFSIDADGVISDASYSTSNVTTADIQGTNGVIHAIDKVLLPNDVFQSILDETLNLKDRLEDRGYTSFLAAAEKAGLTSSLETEELTVFVPSNEAFNTFLSTIENFDSLDDFETPEEIELLKSVLEYHLHAGTVMSSALTDGALSTVQGDELTVETGAGRLVPSYEYAPNANLQTTNIGAMNGVIHQIGNVLVSAEDAAALGYPVPATGAPEFALPVYYDTVESGFQDSWDGWGGTYTFNNTENVSNGSNSIKLEYEAGSYGAIQIGGPSPTPDISSYTTFHFSAYGAPGSGTTNVLVSLCDCDAGVEIQVEEGEWTTYSIPISNFTDTSLGAIRFKNNDEAASTIYVDDIGFDLMAPAAPSFALPVYYDEGTESGFNDTWDGWGGTYTWASTEQVQDGTTAVKLEYDADSYGAMQIGGADPIPDLSGYSTFNFSAYGAPGSGTKTLLVSLCGCDAGVEVQVVEGEWTDFSIPLSSFTDTSLGEIRIKNNVSDSYTIYVDNIGFN
ncbi:fasciclin domain-containing protein [Zunongwangia sp. H14]|uniref:fasciclin domain-containing protein n=1 Tax=Zunongwangia sp. H14 TaxID=3240792 RepID=UPI00356A6588